MQPPKWKDVGIPNVIVQAVRKIPASFLLDCLVHQMVYHNYKKIIPSYNCEICGHIYVPTRSTEEISHCQNNSCQSKRVKCYQTLKLSGERKIPFYSRGSKFLLSMIKQMNTNFSVYFKSYPERDIDWEWHDNNFHVAFAGGDTAQDPIPRVALSKAAILTPYLWDSFFDWKNSSPCDKADQRHISHIINQLVVRNKSR